MTTAHTDPEMIVEHQEDLESVQEKAALVAELIKKSKHVIFFTGAGISTSAGVPDFRGPEGAWTLKAQGRTRKGPTTSTLKAIPTPTHMSILTLLRNGLAKYLVSQNTDGLHRKSGVPPTKISELHGNSNLEICTKCGKQYLRDFRVRTAMGSHEHNTGRFCTKPNCQGELMDTIINFGENLPVRPLELAYQNGEKADLCISLGSSLTVTPAADIPKTVGKNGKLVIVNLQKTPLDSISAIRVFAKTDLFMQEVMKCLGLPVMEWRLRRWVMVGNVFDKTNKSDIFVRGLDVDYTPATILQSVTITSDTDTVKLDKEPFQITIPFGSPNDPAKNIKIKLEFMGHYNEPTLDIDHQLVPAKSSKTLYALEYNPFNRTWQVTPTPEGAFPKELPWLNDLLLQVKGLLQ